MDEDIFLDFEVGFALLHVFECFLEGPVELEHEVDDCDVEWPEIALDGVNETAFAVDLAPVDELDNGTEECVRQLVGLLLPVDFQTIITIGGTGIARTVEKVVDLVVD